MHYYMYNQIHRRSSDGIHWNQDGVRMQVNIILTHFCQSRQIPLPGRWRTGTENNASNVLLEETNNMCEQAGNDFGPKELPIAIANRKYVKAKRGLLREHPPSSPKNNN